MLLEETKQKMKDLEELAKIRPEKKAIYRLQWKAYRAAIDMYYRLHPEEKQTKIALP